MSPILGGHSGHLAVVLMLDVRQYIRSNGAGLPR